MEADKLYRYEEQRYSTGVDEWDNTIPGYTLQVTLREYAILRQTPKGVWIRYLGSEKFVLSAAKKRFAHQTKEEALASFISRKERQAGILRAQLHDVERCLSAAKEDPRIANMRPWDGVTVGYMTDTLELH